MPSPGRQNLRQRLVFQFTDSHCGFLPIGPVAGSYAAGLMSAAGTIKAGELQVLKSQTFPGRPVCPMQVQRRHLCFKALKFRQRPLLQAACLPLHNLQQWAAQCRSLYWSKSPQLALAWLSNNIARTYAKEPARCLKLQRVPPGHQKALTSPAGFSQLHGRSHASDSRYTRAHFAAHTM